MLRAPPSASAAAAADAAMTAHLSLLSACRWILHLVRAKIKDVIRAD